MNPEQAEEYTQALGQVVAGGWRQVALGQELGVPKSLGLTTREWVEQRLGGYVRLSIPERREAATELAGNGYSQRQIADVLGVSQSTIRDVVSESTQSDAEQKPMLSENTQSDPKREALAEYIAEVEQEPDIKAVKLQARFSKWLWQIHQAHLFDPQEIAAIAPDQITDLEETLRDLGAFTEAFRRTLRDTRMQIIDGGRP